MIDIPAGVAYIASPYSHPDPAVRAARHDAVLDFQVRCLQAGIRVFSPIVHAHPAALLGGLPTDAAFWWGFNRTMLAACDRMFFLKIDGWKTSLGMEQELGEALSRPGFPIVLFEPVDAGVGFKVVLTLNGDTAVRDALPYGGMAEFLGGAPMADAADA